MKALSLSLLLLAAVSVPLPAAAETVNCINITSLPATISTQGVYCLKQDLATSITSGAAITIDANNVTLDCNEYKIGGASAGPATLTDGIRSQSRSNITVRNCNVRGFYRAIVLDSGAGQLVENNRVDLSTFVGIGVVSHASVIRGNRVSETGGSSLTQTYGIIVGGEVHVLDNTVSDVVANPTGSTYAFGISVDGANGKVIAGNRVSGLYASPTGHHFGIDISNSPQAMVHDNYVAFGADAVQINDAGIRCGGVPQLLTRDNMVSGFPAPAVPYLGCAQFENVSN